MGCIEAAGAERQARGHPKILVTVRSMSMLGRKMRLSGHIARRIIAADHALDRPLMSALGRMRTFGAEARTCDCIVFSAFPIEEPTRQKIVSVRRN
jgi:hypothetical protein